MLRFEFMKPESKKLNILYILADRGLDLTVYHGYRIHVLKILDGLRKNGHKPFLITINDNKHLQDFRDYICIPHRYLMLIHKILPYTGTINSLNVIRNCIKLQRKVKIDVIHERYGLYSFAGVIASIILKIPLILEVNEPLIEEKQLFTKALNSSQKLVASIITRLCYYQADKIVAVSNVMKSILVRDWNVTEEKIFVLPNAADTNIFYKSFNTKDIKTKLGLTGYFVIGFVGTLHAWYGIENLISALALILKQLPNSKLMIIGDGQMRNSLIAQAKELGIDDNVIFTGHIEHKSVLEILSSIDIAVAPFKNLPMEFYGSAIKVFEYMAAGKAIVASRIGQLTEVLVHKQTALLVEPGNIQELSSAILRLVNTPELKKHLEANSRKESNKYSWDNYNLRLEDIYRSALQKKTL